LIYRLPFDLTLRFETSDALYYGPFSNRSNLPDDVENRRGTHILATTKHSDDLESVHWIRGIYRKQAFFNSIYPL
jgi:hypothetical protein